MHKPLEPERRRTLRRRLEALIAEHRALDEEISALAEGTGGDQLGIQRLKRRKLRLRDEIEHLKSALIPDLNA